MCEKTCCKKKQQKFEKGTNFIDQSAIHKFILPSLEAYGIWHAAHQSTDYFPIKEDIKVLLTIHDLNFLHEVERSGIKKKRAQEKLQRKIERADKIVAISEFVADDLKQHFQFDLKKLQVIYNGCNIDETKTALQQLSIVVSDRKEEGGQFLHFNDPDGTSLYFIKPKW